MLSLFGNQIFCGSMWIVFSRKGAKRALLTLKVADPWLRLFKKNKNSKYIKIKQIHWNNISKSSIFYKPLKKVYAGTLNAHSRRRNVQPTDKSMKITWIDSQEMFVQQSLKNKLYLLKIEVFCPNGCSKDHNRQMAAFISYLSKCTWLSARTVSDVAHLTWSFPPLTQTPIHALISLKQSLSAQLQQPVIEQDCGHFLSEIYTRLYRRPSCYEDLREAISVLSAPGCSLQIEAGLHLGRGCTCSPAHDASHWLVAK